jgi:hypothetical protein
MSDAKQFAAQLAAWTKAGLPVVSEPDWQARLAICQACPQIGKPSAGKCGLCGCDVETKAWIAGTACPDKSPRWTAHYEWFFSSALKRKTLLAELESWLGTPFWAQTKGQAVKGTKADCVSFVESVMVSVGACSPVQWPAYVTNGGGSKMLVALIQALSKVPKLEKVWETKDGPPDKTLMVGDVMAGSSGRAMHHVAIKGVANDMWHCVERYGVCKGNLQDPFLKAYLFAIYRFRP